MYQTQQYDRGLIGSSPRSIIFSETGPVQDSVRSGLVQSDPNAHYYSTPITAPTTPWPQHRAFDNLLRKILAYDRESKKFIIVHIFIFNNLKKKTELNGKKLTWCGVIKMK